MSVGIATQNHYAYMDQHVEGGATVQYPGARSSQINAEASAETSGQETAQKDINLFGEDGFGFDDFLDIINPLQHIPVISTLYREITGDQLNPGARIIGGGIFGGGVGLAASVVNTVIEVETGKDIGGHVAALVSGEEIPDETMLATTSSAPQSPTPAVTPTSTPQIIPASFNAPKPTVLEPKPQASAPNSASTPVQSRSSNQEKSPAQPPLMMGLEWKTQPPNLHKNIDNIRAAQGENLTPEQLARILGAFNQAPAARATTVDTKAQTSEPDQVGRASPGNPGEITTNAIRNSNLANLTSQTDQFGLTVTLR
ncbi:hypothetical protein [Sneathiella glossodoripedis]|uniref:hypothetical protein n=1 Tax=Sneathiella glossodoripedis TaxID=418853 RepID=UPI000471B257|nr:hypothetical protein [Sneathiella glossodoripedis]